MAAAMQHQHPQQQQQAQVSKKEPFNHTQYHHLHHLHHHNHPSVQHQLYQAAVTHSPPLPEVLMEPPTTLYYQQQQQQQQQPQQQPQQSVGCFALEQQHQYSTNYEFNEQQHHEHLLNNTHFRYQQSSQHEAHSNADQQLYTSPRAKLLNQGQEEQQQQQHQRSSQDDCSSENKITAPSAVLTELVTGPTKPLNSKTENPQEEVLPRKRKRSASSLYEDQQHTITSDYSWCQQQLKAQQATDRSSYSGTSPYLSITSGPTTNYDETTSTDEHYYKQLASTYDSSNPHITTATTEPPHYLNGNEQAGSPRGQVRIASEKQTSSGGEFNQLRVLEMRKEKSRDAARSRRSKENHEFYELAKLLPLPAAITSQLDFLDKASIIRLTISFLKLRQFSVNGHPPWAPDFTTLGSVNPYSSQQYVSNSDTSIGGLSKSTSEPTLHAQSPSVRLYSSPTVNQEFLPEQSAFNLRFPSDHLTTSGYHQNQLDGEKSTQLKNSASLFDIHLGTHILQSLDGFAFAIGRDGRFLYISETVSMYLGLSQVEMTGSSVFDYTHQQDHEELARQLGIPFTCSTPPATSSSHLASDNLQPSTCDSPAPASVHSQYSAASNETLIDDYINNNNNNNSSPCGLPLKRPKLQQQHHSNQITGGASSRVSFNATRINRRSKANQRAHGIKLESTGQQYSNSPYTLFNAGTSSKQLKEIPSSGDKSLKEESTMTVPDGVHDDPLVRQFCIRMKSTLTKRGCQHFKSSGYRVVHVVAHLRSYQSNDHGHLMDPLDEAGSTGNSNSSMNLKQTRNRRVPKTTSTPSATTRDSTSSQCNNGKQNNTTTDTSLISDTNNHGTNQSKQKIIGMVAVAIALPPPSINELRLESDTFVLKLGPDLRITHIEPRITELLNYPVELMAGRSLYSLVHPADVMQLQRCHKDLLRKGQIMSGYYRLLARNGGYLWIQTCATLICNSSMPPGPNQATPITAASPVMAPQIIQDQFHHQSSVNKIQQLPNYLPTALLNTDTPHYGIPGSATGKMMSPSLSSYQESHHETDQCVIFVNYMITNVMESDVIMDVCQSSQVLPTTFSTSSGYNTQQPGGNILFSSSASSCSASPCSLGLLKSSSATTLASYLSPSTTPSFDTSRLNHSELPSSGAQLDSSGEKLSINKNKSITNGRIRHTGYKLKQPTKTTDESSNLDQDKLIAQVNFRNLLEPSGKNMDPSSVGAFNLLNMNSHQHQHENSSSSTNTLYTTYPRVQAASDGMNSALATVTSKTTVQEHTSWLSNHQQHQTNTGSRGISNGSLAAYGEAAAAVTRQVSGSNHYSPMNHPIYKAAFGLDVNASSNSYQQTSSVYQPVNNAASTSFQQVAVSPQANSAGTWDTASAVAAVAAVNQYQHHQPAVAHHQHHQTQASHTLSSYAHHHHQLEPHHHLESAHSQAISSAAAAAAAAVAVNHHSVTTSNNYYNYCGYYGNKFI